MPTYWTQTLIPTARNVPAEAEVPSHQLMLRAGMIRKLGAGIYDYLPLGLRSLQKAMSIIREEMARAGAIEVLLPAMVPIELYQQTGRDQAYGDNLFRLKDRHGREQALGPTHEEIITELVGAYVESYKGLPLTLYQIQTKFRDEFRPRFGVLRSREFQMKDAYSFHTSVEGPGGLNEIYEKQYAAYERVFTRCGLPYVTVEAESGPIGGSASHEFMVPSPTGEDTILESDKGNYAANVEKAEIGPRTIGESFAAFSRGGHAASQPAAPPTGALEKVHTPNCPGIDDVAKFMKAKPKHMLKTLLFKIIFATNEATNRYIMVVLRGDHDVNEGKLGKIAAEIYRQNPGYKGIELAPIDQARGDGFVIGFVGPHVARKSGMARRIEKVIADPDSSIDQFWITGANEQDHHVKHFHWKRDFLDTPNEDSSADHTKLILIADIRNAVAGDPSPKNDGGVLRTRKGIEIGHVFKLGDKYTKAMNVTVLGPDNQRMHPIMGCYGIGVNRILAAAIERQGGSPAADDSKFRGHDENGIIWPSSIAPFQVVITTIKYDGAQKAAADKLAGELERLQSPTAPLSFFHPDVLIDDRDERPGVKFKDADLIGIPVRVTIGDKALAEGKVEIKVRNAPANAKPELVPVEQAAARVIELLKDL